MAAAATSVRHVAERDRFGLGFRAELMGGIAANASRIDVLEVLAEDALAQTKAGLRALRTLGEQVPLVVHGVALGLASTEPLDDKRLSRMARTVEALRPLRWSEHLAFVRASGFEIGHLAAPPRDTVSVEAVERNVRRAHAVVGAPPAVENVATLIDPPGSDRSEAAWLLDVLDASGADLLLDLHNLHANATNFGWDALDVLRAVPADRIAMVHLAGGRFIGPPSSRRLLDDHLHAVPDVVFTLLEEVAARATGPLTVIVERDGKYPPIEELMAELQRAREAVQRGRARFAATFVERHASAPGPASASLQPLLAGLYTDAKLLEAFLADAHATATRFGLDAAAAARIARVDRGDLKLAAASFERKRRRA